jgi:hypothetical protein
VVVVVVIYRKGEEGSKTKSGTAAKTGGSKDEQKWKEGRQKGRTDGRKNGRANGRTEGRTDGRTEERKEEIKEECADILYTAEIVCVRRRRCARASAGDLDCISYLPFLPLKNVVGGAGG